MEFWDYVVSETLTLFLREAANYLPKSLYHLHFAPGSSTVPKITLFVVVVIHFGRFFNFTCFHSNRYVSASLWFSFTFLSSS